MVTLIAVLLAFLAPHSVSPHHSDRHPSIHWCDSTQGKRESVCWDHDKANGYYLVINHTDVFVPKTGDYIEDVFKR